jgi:FkbM family methyltransferase
LGGGMGVVSCLLNRRLQHPERHVVVEASPGTAELLKRNRDLNGCQFTVIEAAVAYDCETVSFSVNPRFTASRVNGTAGTTFSVPAVTVASVADRAGFDRFSLVCDVEGTEGDLVAKELEVLRDRVGFCLIEVHENYLGHGGIEQLLASLQSIGFKSLDHASTNWAMAKS